LSDPRALAAGLKHVKVYESSARGKHRYLVYTCYGWGECLDLFTVDDDLFVKGISYGFVSNHLTPAVRVSPETLSEMLGYLDGQVERLHNLAGLVQDIIYEFFAKVEEKQKVYLYELEHWFTYYGDVYWRVYVALDMLLENDEGRIAVTSRFGVRTEFRLHEPDSADADLLQSMLLALSEALEAPALARINRRDRTGMQSHSSVVHAEVEVFEGLG
jgi:hypothetical protein